jgi:tetratricopeptide (TPR) repeat protein
MLGPRERNRDWIYACLAAVALIYAFCAGLRTAGDFDLGWQLAAGRYVVQHYQIPSTELFSYTVPGTEWIYPAFSGVLLYLAYALGGFAALSWLNTLACCGTVAALVCAGRKSTATLAILAVPIIAFRTTPRAELFTTVLFAVLLCLLWRHYRSERGPLWLLPIIFLAWANLHLGFVAGLALLCAYVLFELCDCLLLERRAAALARLKRATPWIVASFVATLINPWGLRIYEAVLRQNRVVRLHSAVIGEWSAVHFNALAWDQATNARDPESGNWWLIGIAVAAILALLWKRRIGPAIVLGAAIYLSLAHVRFQALFAVLVVVLGGWAFSLLTKRQGKNLEESENRDTPSNRRSSRASPSLAWSLAGILACLVTLHISDLVTDRYYLRAGQISLFGAGESWWFPERATEFLLREHLPGRVFHDYSLGGYLTFRLAPNYQDFVDGRFIPFGEKLFAEQGNMMTLPPDSAEWKQKADQWGIQTLIFSVARFAGLGSFPLQAYCESETWKPVYLDDTAAIFVRNLPQNAETIQHLGIHCRSVRISAPLAAAGASFRARAERYNFLVNTASILYFLGRDAETGQALQQAEQIFGSDANEHLLRGQLSQADGRVAEAESQYKLAIELSPSDAAWRALATLYMDQKRYAEAARCEENAAGLSLSPHERFRGVGQIYLAAHEPQKALAAFDHAERVSPHLGDESEIGMAFHAQIAQGRARAYQQLGDLTKAVQFQGEAVKLTPRNAAAWNALADLYQAAGDSAKADAARAQAQ